MPNVDMRSAAGRRFRDIVDSVIAEFGNSNPEAIRELAGLRFTREQVQGDVVTGAKPRAAEELVRIGRLITRLEGAMRQAAAAARTKTPNLAEYLSTYRQPVPAEGDQ
jgi:hypothetical protein